MEGRTDAPSAAARACAWGGAAAFVASLSFTLFSYDISFGREREGPVSPAAVIWNTALFSVFALHHSLFARTGLRERVSRAFPRLERSIYVWVASILLVLVCLFWRAVPGVVWRVDGVVAVVVYALHVAGIVLAVASAAAIDIWELAGVKQITSQIPTPPPSRGEIHARFGETSPGQGPDEFKTTGLYGLVRHPIYLGWFLLVFGVPHMTATRFVFAVVSSAYVLIAIPFEERSLLETTSGAYERYRQKVRFRLVPGIY